MTAPIDKRHVLVVGIDGVRADELHAARTPHLDAIAAAGFLSEVRVDERNPTISGPVWATVASGVYGDVHGIRDNDLRGNRLAAHPDFLARIRAARPQATTFAGASWGPLVTDAAGGPVFAGGGYRPGMPDGAEDGSTDDEIAVIEAMDDAVVSRTARELLHRDHAAVFCYVVLVDMIGHAEGVTPRYRTAVETCDEQLGVLMAAIEARPHRAEEEWTVIVVTDHGHRDAGHHGGDSDEERTAWIAAAGPGITAASGVGVDHADIPVHVLTRLGIPIEGAWGLEGVDFGERAGTADARAADAGAADAAGAHRASAPAPGA